MVAGAFDAHLHRTRRQVFLIGQVFDLRIIFVFGQEQVALMGWKLPQHPLKHPKVRFIGSSAVFTYVFNVQRIQTPLYLLLLPFA